MAKTLENIQQGARFNAKNDELLIVAGPGLVAFNSIYSGVANAFPWPELKLTETLSDTTVSGTKVYGWASTNVFQDVRSIEVGSTATDAQFHMVEPPLSESHWSEVAKDASSIPIYYMRFREDSDYRLELRPAPSYTGASIRVTGIIEPAELTTHSSTTIFLMETADNVLEHLVAAGDLDKRGERDAAKTQIERGVLLLAQIFGSEAVTSELITSMVL